MTNLEIRSMTVRSVDTEARTVTGIAVPYGQTTDVGGYKERFEAGAFKDAADVKLFYGHSEPIGLVTEGRDTDDGYEITARISNTARGDEVYTLLKDGVLNKFSVGFLPVEDRWEDDVVVRTKADLKEVSVVAFPAYAGANVSEVRNQDSDGTAAENSNDKGDINMSDVTKNDDVADLRSVVEDMERRMAVLADARNDSAVSAPQFRSGGEWLKALGAGSQEARDFATSLESGANRVTWIGGAQRLLDENRNVVNLFNKQPLPSSGNTIEYAAMPTGTGTVDRQQVEGELLPYMEVVVSTGNAPVYTYGGYSSLSRQAIERSDVSYLDTVLRYQTLQYAKATNKAVREMMVNSASPATAPLAADNAGAWIEAVSLSADEITNVTGYEVDFIVVSSDVFMRLAKMTDTTGRPVFAVNGDGQNTWGNVNIKGRTASIAGIPVVVDPALAANSAFVASREAITVFESAGAPFRLQDEDILRLTKDFSLYGYMAVADSTNGYGLLKLDVDLVA